MKPYWARNSIATAFGLSATLAFAVLGCGGDSKDAVVRIEPGANVNTTPGAGAPAPTGGTATSPAAASTTPAPSASVKSEGWGTLKGQVVFGSNAPPVEDLVAKGQAPKDPTICAKDGPIKSERLVVDPDTKGVKNVLVYIPRPTAIKDEAKAAAASATVEFDQEACVFKPHVLGVMANAKIAVKSSDPVSHNVNTRGLKINDKFNQIVGQGKALPYVPSAGERSPAEVVCDIHPWMKAYWLVLDNPYFAVTDDKGNFEIKNAPAGTQKVVVWQESVRGGFVTPGSGEEVTIKADDTSTKSFTIDPGKILPAK